MQIRPYITFDGNCQEALNLYSKAFNREPLQVARVKDMPQNPNQPFEIPEDQKNRIIQATFPMGENFIRMSDCMGGMNENESDRVSISVECSVDEVKHAFKILAETGKIGIDLQETFFSPCHGVVYDKFGVMWVFVADPKQ